MFAVKIEQHEPVTKMGRRDWDVEVGESLITSRFLNGRDFFSSPYSGCNSY